MTPFDFINSISFDKKNLFEDPQAEKDYIPFIVNRGLSYFPDTVFLANEMNRASGVPKRWQFDFFINTVSKRKRFSKWSKKDTSTEDLLLVQEYYGYSREKALSVMQILTTDQINTIKLSLCKGGR